MIGLLWVTDTIDLCDLVSNEDLLSIYSSGNSWALFVGAYDEREGVSFPKPVFPNHEFVPEIAVRVWRV